MIQLKCHKTLAPRDRTQANTPCVARHFFHPRPKISGTEPKINLLSFEERYYTGIKCMGVRGSDANYSIFHLAQSGSNLSEGRSCERIYFIRSLGRNVRRVYGAGLLVLLVCTLSLARSHCFRLCQRQHLSGAFPAFNSVPDRCEFTAGCNQICLQETHGLALMRTRKSVPLRFNYSFKRQV